LIVTPYNCLPVPQALGFLFVLFFEGYNPNNVTFTEAAIMKRLFDEEIDQGGWLKISKSAVATIWQTLEI
jgi:hypothetical protein